MYTPQSRESYIASCRYYKGEERCPKRSTTFWRIERMWVVKHFEDGGIEFLRECVREYKSQGLTSFMTDDGTPIALKALLLGHYQGFTWGSADSFRGWYKEKYLQMRPLNSEQ